ncbi:hypothetical protein C8J56DRAFT_955897 [Mycena floridula]|nr:hypothetical protein C8J56DRAFT_955897 [Mycena floridula]
MQRFRKRSDAKRSPDPSLFEPQQLSSLSSSDLLSDRLPELPPASDFRASLIVNDLSRRFSILGSSSDDPLLVDALKSRLADQRARGAENQLTEEEEDMILETLGFRSKNSSFAAERSEESIQDSNGTQSVRSSSTVTSSISGRKRYSNNLFGSGKFRDYTYIRGAAQGKTSSIRARSNTEFLEPDNSDKATPDNVQSEKAGIRSAPLIPPAPYGENTLSAAEYRLSKTMGPSGFKRASMALEEAIRELEEEAEDEIVMPRSAPISRTSFDQHRVSDSTGPRWSYSPDVQQEDSSPAFEPGTAISPDRHRSELDERRASPVPSRTVPGYIPGMPRPMTPRDNMEVDDQRSHSTTPRATSPTSESPNSSTIPHNTIIRRDSAASPTRQPTSPVAPMFLQRSPISRPDYEFPPSSSIPGRRRPASPLSSPPYQPLTVSSRPGTPSNITWVPPSSQKPAEHNRNGSWFSDASSEFHTEQTKPQARSLKSPPLPDSPLIERTHATMLSSGSGQSSSSSFETRPPSSMSASEFNFPAPPSTRIIRSPTPTQNGSMSPTSPTFSPDISPSGPNRRSSRQNPSSTLSSFLPILLSPIASSSRSSLESAGSSYHSWEGEKDRTYNLFHDTEIPQPSWHDISFSEQSSSTTPGGSPGDDYDAEEVINKCAGLKKSDFLAIQDKLVSVALTKNTPDRNSSLRRRRPSTSQSNYSISGPRMANSPPVQPTSPTPTSPVIDQYSTLLNALVDSIQSPPPNITLINPADKDRLPSREPSPSARRNRDLAQVLFGQENDAEPDPSSVKQNSGLNPDTGSHPMPSMASYSSARNPSSPRLHPTEQEKAELARDVQRRAEAANIALRKQPSSTNLLEGLPPTSSVRKRVNPNQISTPTLVSASTSVDTIPLRSPSLSQQQSTSKIGSRFRKLRGTLRKVNSPAGEEITPYPLDLRSPPASQTIRYDPENLVPPGMPVAASATESRFKVPVPSPPASAGPGLKGFMSRFRGKQRPEPSFHEGRTSTQPLSANSAPHLSMPDGLQRSSPQIVSSPYSEPIGFHPSRSPDDNHSPPASTNESVALKQLFDAASNLGLDQRMLNDLLLVRSGSTSSRSTDWTMQSPGSGSPVAPEKNTSDRRARRASIDNTLSRNGSSVGRKASLRKPADFVRKPREGQADPANPVVRRTIVFASDANIDLNTLARKTSARRRRASATSISSRSVHDRVPTPPPRSPTGGRFSSEASPPVPQLPRSFAAQGLGVPPFAGGPIEKSSSNYDSLYDMYSEDIRVPGAATQAADSSHEQGPALEVLELANGEVIWSIVNGLRDDDSDSVYHGRASFASEYEPDEGMKVFFKEHARNSSKGSGSSFVSRKKPQTDQRPNTQIYVTPSAHIGRLIEDLSQGLEAGSFNFAAANGFGHSATSSMSENELNWSVEERLDRMLGAMRAS